MPLDPHAAASPVRWLEWGSAAFARAREEDKPILLRISAVWCHWCHVMDETTDADPEVARRMNEWFVPVRVDNDERPDINDRYNLGGWPTTAFLTPRGDLITGGTYFPAAQFREILERIHNAWNRNRDELAAEVDRIRSRRREARGARDPRSGVSFDGAALTQAVESILDAYDWRFGGFGREPKFPQPEAVRLLLHAHAGSGADAPREAAERTLTLMRTAGVAEGRTYGLYDHAGGGFFRYSTTRDWTEPHFEKMCEDNARLVLAYLDAYRLLGDDLYAGTARGIMDFVLRTLSDPDGGAHGSQDADGEAAYYGKTLAERAALPTPYIDRRLYANWNGMMVVAAFEAAAVLEWPELGDWARRTVDRLTKLLGTPEGNIRHVWRPSDDAAAAPEARAPAAGGTLLLTDQAWWLEAQLAAYQATGDPRCLRHAEKLAWSIERDFFDARRGACRDRAADFADDESLTEPHYPLLDNAAAATGLATFAALGGGERWLERAATIVDALQEEVERLGFLGAPLALAAVRVHGEPVRVHLVGAAGDARLRALWRTAWRRYAPGRVVEILDPALDGDRLESLGYAIAEAPRAYVCIGDQCLAPVTEPGQLDDQLAELEPRPAGSAG